MASASSAVARFSEVSRYPEGRSPETVKRRSQDASVSACRLTAAILALVGDQDAQMVGLPVAHDRLQPDQV